MHSKVVECTMMENLWKISFKTRISGYYKIAYKDEEVFILAPTKALALAIFEKCLKQNKRNGVWGVMGSELKTYSNPKLSSPDELLRFSKSFITTFERKAHTEADIDALLQKRAKAMAAQNAAFKARYGQDLFDDM